MKLRLNHLLWPHISRIGRCLSVVLLGLTAVGFSLAQQPVDRQSLGSLTFVRQSFARNFYNTYKVMSVLLAEREVGLHDSISDVAHGAPLKSLYTPCPHPPTTGEWGHGFLI